MSDKVRPSISTTGSQGLIGRERELARIRSAWNSAWDGKGGLLLVSGEAGVGKTRLVRVALEHPDEEGLFARAEKGATPPYGPLLSALRQYLRLDADGLSPLGPLLPYLARLLPELGEAQGGDKATQLEALLSGFDVLADAGTHAVTLDDLQWADNATIDFLPHLAERLQDKPLLVVGIYRADEIPRDHALRSARAELRRAHLLEEIALGPLDEEQTRRLARQVLGEEPGPALAETLYRRTRGVPLFVKELCGGLVGGTDLRHGDQGLEIPEGQEIPLPETVRDATLMRIRDLSEQARDLLEIAAVAGQNFDPELVQSLAESPDGFEELFDKQILVDRGPNRMGFRQSLTRDAVYGEITWSRQRKLHRAMAERLKEDEAGLRVIAEHYLAGRQLDAARETLFESAKRSCTLYAHRDAITAIEKALEIWPEGNDEELYLDALDTLASCAELSGMPQRAVRARREIAATVKAGGDLERYANVNRKLAKVYEMQGMWDQAQTARLEAAEAFAASYLPGEAATERLAVASHLHSAASYHAALTLTTALLEEAQAAERYDVLARGLGLKGALLAKTGDVERGREFAQRGLSMALDHDATAAAAEVYHRLASVGEQASNYDSAVGAYDDAFRYCEQHDVDAIGNFCLACLSVVLRYVGDWDQAEEICRQVLGSEQATDAGRAVAGAVLGLIEASRGRPDSARRLLSEASAIGRFYDAFSIEVTAAWGLAIAHNQKGHQDMVKAQCDLMLERWSETEERHYVISPLRWAATWYAERGDGAGARACADALSQIATGGKSEALAGLAHALGEVALLDQDTDYAVEQFVRALDLLNELDLPYERAETRLRLAQALIEADQRQEGIAALVRAYRTAQKLGARDLTQAAGVALESIGESVEDHLGRRAAQRIEGAGLTKRQMEVLGLVAEGLTNREIADELVLSPRTVEMHVSNILSRMDCRSRTEAVKKATDLGLLE